MDYYKIGQNIRKFRKAQGLSQEELAERVDISTTHMSHIETGSTKLSLPVLVEIAAALEVRTDEILNDGICVSKSAALDDISAVLSHCSPGQARMLADMVRATKSSIDKYL